MAAHIKPTTITKPIINRVKISSVGMPETKGNTQNEQIAMDKDTANH
ncbi:hypothetical protein ACOI1C_21995 [Bacillus sp. DJP31]